MVEPGILKAWLKRQRPSRKRRSAIVEPNDRADLPKRPWQAKEGRFQITLMEWWTLKHRELGVPDVRLLCHIPNGGQMSESQRKIAAAMGVRPGAPDLFLAVPRHECPGLFLELKAPKQGRLRANQRSFHETLKAQGYRTEVAASFGDATRIITEYLSREPTAP